jgi:hypothetical protein
MIKELILFEDHLTAKWSACLTSVQEIEGLILGISTILKLD